MPSVRSAGPRLLKELRPIPLPDLIARLHANPLRDGAVLLLLLREEAFDLEGLVRRLQEKAALSAGSSARPRRGRGDNRHPPAPPDPAASPESPPGGKAEWERRVPAPDGGRWPHHSAARRGDAEMAAAEEAEGAGRGRGGGA